jgi:hypothetical protein
MRILLSETNSSAGDAVAAELAAAGHDVVRCHSEGAPTFPCSGLAGNGCPVEEGVDVAVTVRSHPRSTPAPTEDGVICALRRRVPIVVAGRTLFQPYSGFDVTEVADESDLVATVEQTASDRRPQHEAVAQPLLEEALRNAGVTGPARAVVTRSRTGLTIRLELPPETPEPVRSRASVRVVGGVRAYDPTAPQINVAVAEIAG